jgi:hypothetical protein
MHCEQASSFFSFSSKLFAFFEQAEFPATNPTHPRSNFAVQVCTGPVLGAL